MLLNDEEMKALKPDVPNCQQMVFGCEDCSAQCGLTAKAQLKKVVDWGNEDCPHAGYINSEALLHKHNCYTCWLSLLKEIE